MQQAKDRAAARRHRGLPTGKAAKGWFAKPRPADADPPWLRSIDDTLIRLRLALADIRDMADRLAGRHPDDIPF
jgi:hypothetical protein